MVPAMTGDLHDRIAAVVNMHYGLQFCQCGWKYDPKLDNSYADHVADAVIRELGLTREDNEADFTGPYRHRYVTDWKTAE